MFSKFLSFSVLILLTSCLTGSKKIEYPSGETYKGELVNEFTAVGEASWYGDKEHGRNTASGEKFNRYNFTAAHKSLPFGTMVRVTNLDNGKDVVVKINDRGPFIKNRIIDLAYAPAKSIGLIKTGTGKVKIEVLSTPSKRKSNIFNPIYTVQVGSFSSKINAISMKNDINSLINSEVRIESIDIRGESYYRVRVGMYSDRKDAEKIRRTLKNYGFRGKIYLE